ncbi:hypothetical protein COBT_002453 [Conglomerata obtusa]
MKHGLKAVLTGVASQKTTMEYYFYLVDIILKLNSKNNYYNNNNFLRDNNTIFISKEYKSIKFQAFFEQELKNEGFNNLKPSIFYFNFYNYYGCDTTISWPYMLHSSLQNELSYILNFSYSFLEEERTMKICHVFVFNIFYLQDDLLNNIINVEDKGDYGIRLAREYENIKIFLKDKNFDFPRCFIIKHQNMELTMDTITYDGQPLSFHYRPNMI